MKNILTTTPARTAAGARQPTAKPAPDRESTVFAQLSHAMAARDPVALAACFAADYRSEQPLHPARAFRGADQVRENWTEIFKNIPDLREEILREASDGHTAWREFRWFGHKHDGSPFERCGMIAMGISAGKIAWARLYFGAPERSGDDIDSAVKRETR